MTTRISIFILFVFAFTGTAIGQTIVKGSGAVYTNGAPTHAVNVNTDSEIAIDTAAGLWYEYDRDAATWKKAGWRVQRLNISIAPTAAPTDKQSEIVVNDVDSLYQWRGGAWRHLNAIGDPSITNEGQLGVGAGGATSSVITSNTSGATGVTINAAGILAITESTSSNGGSITLTATEVDGSITNEGSLTVGAGGANSSTIVSNTSGSTAVTIAGGTNVTITETGSTITIAASGGGGSSNYQTWRDDGVAATQQPNANFVSTADIAFTLTNDGANTETEVTADIPAGAVDFAEIQNVATGTLAGRSTAGSGSLEQITVSTGLTIAAGNLTAVDASASNELQTINNTSNATSHTMTLSNSGGSIQFVEGSNVTITTTGTASDAIVTIAASGGGGSTNYQTWYDDGVAATQRANANFVSTGDITFTLTDDGANLETEVTADIPAGAVDFAEIQNVATGTIAGRSTAGSGSLEQITVSTGLTIAAGNLTAVDASASNELQTYGHAGTTTYTNTLSNGGGSFSITGAGIAAVSHTAGAVTITATEVDGSITNEGSLTVGAGGANSSTIVSNTSGSTAVTIAGGTNVTVTESGSTITIAASGGGGGSTVVLKTADESVTSSTTFQADDHLTFTCPANKKCVFEGFLFVTNMHAAEIKVRTVATGATTVRMIGGGGATDYRYMYNQAATLGQIQTNDETGSTHEDGGVDFAGYVLPGASDRTVVIEWAQKVSTAKATTVQSGSFLRYNVID